jgi:nucleoside-diphosphate-sugar epimerase
MEKVLVTGGAGYKGVVLVRQLLEQGYHVTVMDNFMYGYHSFLHLLKYSNLKVIKGDVRNGLSGISEFDVIFHLAGISGFPACAGNPSSAQSINVEATVKLASSLSKSQIFINASTTSMYGKSGLPCDENTPLEPVSKYAQTKLEVEQLLSGWENVVHLRFATVFGFSPKMRMDLMVNDFTYKALKERVLVLFDSFAKRTFIHVEDAAKCYLFALNNFDKMRGQVFNAGGNDFNYSKAEIAAIISKKIEVNVIDSSFSDKDLRHFIVNFDKIEALGYKPSISIEDGVEEMIKAFSFFEPFPNFNII